MNLCEDNTYQYKWTDVDGKTVENKYLVTFAEALELALEDFKEGKNSPACITRDGEYVLDICELNGLWRVFNKRRK